MLASIENSVMFVVGKIIIIQRVVVTVKLLLRFCLQLPSFSFFASERVYAFHISTQCASGAFSWGFVILFNVRNGAGSRSD